MALVEETALQAEAAAQAPQAEMLTLTVVQVATVFKQVSADLQHIMQVEAVVVAKLLQLEPEVQVVWAAAEQVADSAHHLLQGQQTPVVAEEVVIHIQEPQAPALPADQVLSLYDILTATQQQPQQLAPPLLQWLADTEYINLPDPDQ